MRVAVVAARPVPYVFGGAQRLCAALVDWIGAAGHECELVEVDSPERDLPSLLATYAQCSALDLGAYDLVISTKYPTWMLQHPNHVVYMIHPLRGLYDTYSAFDLPTEPDRRDATVARVLPIVERAPDRAHLPELFATVHDELARRGAADPVFAFPGPLARAIVHFLDGVGLDPDHVRAHWAISRTVAGRPGYFPPDVVARAAIPPSSLTGLHRGGATHLFLPGRLDGPKRVDLVIDAMRYVPGDLPLKIAGTGPLEAELRDRASGDPRVEFLGAVDDTRLADLYADAIAVPYVPLDEDLGLVALEAMGCATPVVTCRDSGGPCELVLDERSGLVVAPEADELGAALSRLVRSPELARELGENGRLRARRHTPELVVAALLGDAGPRRVRSRRGRPRIVATTTFPVYPAVGGGQLRCLHLFTGLTESFDVEIVSLKPIGSAAARVALGDGLTEIAIPKSRAHQAAESEIEVAADTPVTDVVASELMRLTPAYADALAQALDGAACVLPSHPYLYPLVERLRPDLPVVYDAQDVEFDLKRPTLGATPVGRMLLDRVHRLEAGVVRAARLVVVCSPEDGARLTAEFGPSTQVVVPNGVAVDATPFVEQRHRGALARRWLANAQYVSDQLLATRHLAIFVGSWHPPNVGAVEVIIRTAAEMPDVAFVVAGSIGGSFADRELPQNVLVTGPVSNHSKLAMLAAAGVALNPVESGSGTNLKMVEYFAAGVPTVSTPTGARGTETLGGVHALLAEPDDFPVAIRRILEDRDLADRLSRAARQLAAERYDWPLLGSSFLAAVREALPDLDRPGAASGG